ncbi:MAG: glycine--tRNA ligase [bacterium]
MPTNTHLDKVTAWAKRRGFVYPSSEIYGGLANTYDFGPYGVILKENLRQLWWKKFMQRADLYPIDSSVIINPKVWEASGHVDNFADVMVEDVVNHRRYRADHLIEEYFAKKGEEKKVDGLGAEKLDEITRAEKLKSPDGNELTTARQFSTLFETQIGIISGDKNKAYLRGEIAQGLFINFKNIIDSFHPKLPFGIGQAGKAYRNEITPGQFSFRTLEFDLMEFEYFFDPSVTDWNELFEYWKKQVHEYAHLVGLSDEVLRWRAHEKFELSHYSSRTEDLEYKFPWGFKEMFAVAYRSDFDLKNHQEKSGKSMEYIFPDGKRIIPHVIEPTFGLSRLATVLMVNGYTEEQVNGTTRTVMKLAKEIVPIQAAVISLQKDEKLLALATEIYQDLQKAGLRVELENSGNIGKMYRRQDEIGTPVCITVDFQSLEDKTVTLRDRDTMAQKRIAIGEVKAAVI